MWDLNVLSCNLKYSCILTKGRRKEGSKDAMSFPHLAEVVSRSPVKVGGFMGGQSPMGLP